MRIVVILAVLCTSYAIAVACRCLTPSLGDAADHAKVVFVGTITNVRKSTTCDPKRPKLCTTSVTYTVKVDSVFKGTADKVVQINPARGQLTSCHTSLGTKVKDTRWLFFLSSPKQPFFLHLCSGTQRATDEAITTITKKLGAPTAP